jgi:CheY-like chemotaxis protein
MARILVVDDDAAVRGTTRRILERAGHTVEVAVNGIEMIQDLRAEYADARILAVSGGVMGERGGSLVDAELFGASATLSKPFTPDQLKETVARLLA